MRPLKKLFAILITTGVALSLSAQEYDDMYFTKADRKAKFTNEVFNENSSFASEEAEPVKITKEEDLAQNSYSAKTINPDYIAKYKSEALDENADPEADDQYYIEEENKTQKYSTASYNSAAPRSAYRRPSYYTNWGWSLTYGYGYNSWNNPYYSPYGYNVYTSAGLYDPYGYYRYNYGYGPYARRYSTAYSAGFYNGYYAGGGYGSALYCPPGYYGGGYSAVPASGTFGGRPVDFTPTAAVQTINNGPRTARNSSAVQTQSGRNYRNTESAAGSSSVPGYVAINDSNTPNSRQVVSNPQGAYYRRSRSTSGEVRTSQRSRVAVTSGQSLNEASSANTRNTYTSGRTSARNAYNVSRTSNSYTRSTVPGSSRNVSRSTVSSRPSSAATRTTSYSRPSNSRSYSPSPSRGNTGRSSNSSGRSGGSSFSGGRSSGSSSGARSSGGGVSSSGRSSGGGATRSGGGGRGN